jgi:Secretion system C-terminal sorting domain
MNINHCIIDSNTIIGLGLSGEYDTVTNNTFSHNPIGISDEGHQIPAFNYLIANNIIERNDTGIKLNYAFNDVYCNTICNNTTYGLYYNVLFGSNQNASNNYWCATDYASISSLIYDGYDNINLGLVTFTPFYLDSCRAPLGTFNFSAPAIECNLYPNPTQDQITLSLPNGIKEANIRIINLMGEKEYDGKVYHQQKLDVSQLKPGIHIMYIKVGSTFCMKRFCKE